MSISQEQQKQVLDAVQRHFVDKRNDNALKSAVETVVGHSVNAQKLVAAVTALCVSGGEYRNPAPARAKYEQTPTRNVQANRVADVSVDDAAVAAFFDAIAVA